MAHFARVDSNNLVQEVIVISDDVAPDPAPNNETAGQQFIANVLGLSGTWKQTSYNGNFRGKFAGIGDEWNPATEEFATHVPTVAPLVEMTTVERDTLTPDLGDMIYNTTTGQGEYWNGSAWLKIDAPPAPELEAPVAEQ